MRWKIRKVEAWVFWGLTSQVNEGLLGLADWKAGLFPNKIKHTAINVIEIQPKSLLLKSKQ